MINQETMESLKSGSGLTFSAVVAMTPSRVIGKNGGMPWHMPEGLKVFKRQKSMGSSLTSVTSILAPASRSSSG